MHTPSIFVVMIVASTLLAGVLAYIGQRRQDHLSWWALAIGCNALAYLMFALRGEISAPLSLIGGNIALVTAYALFGEGLHRFLQRRPPRLALWGPVVLVGPLFALLLDDIAARILASAVLAVVALGASLCALWQARRRTAGRGALILALGVVTVLVVLLLRAVALLAGLLPADHMGSSEPVPAISFVIGFMGVLLVTLGMVVMTLERAEAELQVGRDHERLRSKVLESLAAGAPLATVLAAVVQGVDRLLPGARCRVLPAGVPPAALSGVDRHWCCAMSGADGEPLGHLAVDFASAQRPQASEFVWLGDMARLAALTIQRSSAAESLRRSERQYRHLVEATHDGICVLQGGLVRYFNGRLPQLLGLGANDLVDRPFLHLVHPDDHAVVERSHQRLLDSGGEGKRDTLRLITRDRGLRWFELSGVAFEWEGRPATLNFLTDVTERRLMEERVRELAYHDVLTGLPNRLLLLDRLQQTLAANRRSGLSGALIFLDLDNFKPLNDRHGHNVGDLLLIEVAHRLKQQVRAKDTVSRYGGDEFVVLLTDLGADAAEARAQADGVASKVLDALAAPYRLEVELHGQRTVVEHRCSASVGARVFGAADSLPDSAEALLDDADAAMYRAKEAGCNTVRHHGELV